MIAGYFVTGTDTGVGKTLVAAALLQALAGRHRRVVGMKPVASGCRESGAGLRNGDAEILISAGNVAADYADINPYAFAPAIAPHLAAREAGVKVELEKILDRFEHLQSRARAVVVEGVGGWMVPLGHVLTTEHMAKALNLPVILVVGLRLGCLNHALLTARAIEASGLPMAGWIGNQVDPAMERVEANLQALEKRLTAPCLGVVPWSPQVDFRKFGAYLTLP